MDTPPVTSGRTVSPRTLGMISFIHNRSFFIVVLRHSSKRIGV